MTALAVEAFGVVGLTIVATASAGVGALIVKPPSRSQPLPWWERARRATPARFATVISMGILPQVLLPTAALYFDVIGLRPPVEQFIITGLIPILGPIAVAMFIWWLSSPRNRPLWYWLAGCATAALIRFPNTIVYGFLAVALYAMPHDLPTVVIVLIFGAGAMGFTAWGGSVWVARLLGLARPALPRAEHAARWAGERVGVQPSEVLEVISPAVRVSAFAFSRYLVISDSAATLLSDDELLALTIRGITFFQQRWLVGCLRVADSAVIFIMLSCTAVGLTLGGEAIFAGMMVGFISIILMRPFIRKAQLKADALTANAAIDPVAALRALERGFELNLQPVVAISNRSPEAHLYDRMVAAGIPPNYPRPMPPSKGRVILSIAAAAVTCVVLSIGFLIIVVGILRH